MKKGLQCAGQCGTAAGWIEKERLKERDRGNSLKGDIGISLPDLHQGCSMVEKSALDCGDSGSPGRGEILPCTRA